MPELNDHELLAEFARNESEAAFATLVARYVNLVYSAALRFTGNPHHAEEITQAVFIVLARKAGKLSSRIVLSGWLYQTARLTAANFVKGEIRRERREQEVYMQSTLNEPDLSSWKQLAPLLDEAMGRLGETDRNAVVLRFFENKTAQEVAATLKLNEAAAHKRVERALEKLRKFFTKRGVTLSTAAIAGTVSASSVQAAPMALAKSVTTVAIAKGVTASTSTLTLINGALKIMAWTKTKTAVVVGVVAILAATSTTVIGIKMARAHYAPPDVTVLTTFAENWTINIQPDGTALFKITQEETNNTSRTAIADDLGGAVVISRITDESGKPMKFAKEPRHGFHSYYTFLNKPVPPGGQVSYTIEGTVKGGLIQSKGAGEYVVDFTDSLDNALEAHLVQVWRLPPGAVLLEKISGMEETTNSGQIELKTDQILPPHGNFPVGFRYRLPANAN
jgi:RNA polymerase sigma factor (sigma-70 family)